MRSGLKKHGPKGQRRPKKRADGEGSVFTVERTRKDGTTVTYFWAAKTVELGSERKKFTAQARTEREAIEKRDLKILRARVEYGLESPDSIPPDPRIAKLTVADCLLDWLKERRREDLAPATIHMYDARIRNHLLPAFGSRPVRGLTYEELKVYFTETLPDKGLGVDSIRQTFICFKSALDYYVRDGILYRHPMVGLKAPAKKAKTAEDTLAIRKAADKLGHLIIQEARNEGQELRWVFGLLGLRQAEVLGLTDDCFVERDGLFRLLVKQQLQREGARHGCELDGDTGKWSCGEQTTRCPQRIGENRWVLTDTKTTSGRREIALTAQAWLMIYEHIQTVKQRRAEPDFKPEKGAGLDRLIFTRKDGKPIYGQRDRKELSRLLEQIEYRYGLPEGMTVHTLRHMATTKLIDGGADRDHLIATMGWSPKNADAQIATYSSADYAKQAAPTLAAYLDDYLSEKRPDFTGWEEL
nr:tyrosine-type recombinase/integrase [Leucobacter weissii]